MDQDQEVVIRDPSGTEHVFPAGFDPQRAAAIVRGNYKVSVPQPSASDMLGVSNRGFTRTSQDDPNPQGPLAKTIQGLEPIAHPQSASDLLPLLIPDASAGAMAARNIGKAVTGRGLVGSLLHPIDTIRKVSTEAANPGSLLPSGSLSQVASMPAGFERYMPNAGAAARSVAPVRAEMTAAGPIRAASSYSGRIPYTTPSPTMIPGGGDPSILKQLLQQGLSFDRAMQLMQQVSK